MRGPSCGYIFINQQRAVISYLRIPEFGHKTCNLFLCNFSVQNSRLILKKNYKHTRNNLNRNKINKICLRISYVVLKLGIIGWKNVILGGAWTHFYIQQSMFVFDFKHIKTYVLYMCVINIWSNFRSPIPYKMVSTHKL